MAIKAVNPPVVSSARAESADLERLALRLWADGGAAPPEWGDDALVVEAEGDCMRPLMNDGDRVVIRRTQVPEVRVGDLALLIDHHGVACVHRIARRKRAGTRTVLFQKADDALYPAAVPDGGLIGVAVARVRRDRAKRLDSARARRLAWLLASAHMLCVVVHRLRVRLSRRPSPMATASDDRRAQPPLALRLLGWAVEGLLPEAQYQRPGHTSPEPHPLLRVPGRRR